MKKYWLYIFVILIAVAFVYAAWPKEAHTNLMQTVTVGSTTFKVEVASTETSRELGLGGRALLPQGQGMLFVFDRPGSWGIWMKDMHFPLDIMWMREDGTVITVARNVATSTYPHAFYPAAPDATYVLEVGAGAAAGIAEGTKIVVQ